MEVDGKIYHRMDYCIITQNNTEYTFAIGFTSDTGQQVIATSLKRESDIYEALLKIKRAMDGFIKHNSQLEAVRAIDNPVVKIADKGEQETIFTHNGLLAGLELALQAIDKERAHLLYKNPLPNDISTAREIAVMAIDRIRDIVFVLQNKHEET